MYDKQSDLEVNSRSHINVINAASVYRVHSTEGDQVICSTFHVESSKHQIHQIL